MLKPVLPLRLGRFDRARRLNTRCAAGKRHQRDVAGALQGYAKPPLVTRADAGHAARKNLAALLHELGKNGGALVVDEVHLLDAELADFLLAEILALSAARAAWAAAGTSGAAFTSSTARTAFAARRTAALRAMRGSGRSRGGCGGAAAFRGCWRRRRCGLHWFLFL